ncbi:hypothetical protein ACRAQ6_02175 [Erythrobacter sp. HA6-11]
MKQALWFLSLLLIAAVTAAFQLDRQSRYASQWAEFVPEPARHFAQTHIAVKALQSGDSEAAQVEASTLLSRRPVPAENMRLYAQAAIQNGSAEQGLLALQLSAQRGWRDPIAQEAMARIAWAGGDAAESARRLAALYARAPDGAVLQELADEVLSNPEGRDQMAELLAGSARWEAAFVRAAARDLSTPTYNAVLLAAHEKGAKLSCAPLQNAARQQARIAGTGENETALEPLLVRNC